MFELDPSTPNVLPSRYRQVSLSTEVSALDDGTLLDHFTGREAYIRTRFIVARHDDGAALVEVAPRTEDALFSPITAVRVLAGPDECQYVHDDTIDTGVPSQLARVTVDRPAARCVVVEGLYSHVSFLLNPEPLRLEVLDIVPPAPSKLFDQVQRVLDVAEDLPPTVATRRIIDSHDVLQREAEPPPAHVLLPCRGSGMRVPGATVSYLDERPPDSEWTLLGCTRSQQIHRWFYGRSAPVVDTCPRRFLSGAGDGAGPVLSRCCLLEIGSEQEGRTVFVPWGASLGEVRAAIEALIEAEGVVWTPT